ncbi:carboxypeptidase-like regulatory domain-containing protein [Streptomyces sp. NPDC059853]|uniref:carboxypeptidase-like regulatory domain-containing protein n=1 Tax=Streptomyces sp. NPDC059853 TaxID=3346973 RepID=UPI00364918B6
MSNSESGAAGGDALVIRGTVRDSLGVALPRAVVTLTVAGGRQLEKTRSAADGGFQVTAPAEGDYLLAAFSPQLGEQSVTVSLDGRPVEVEFRIDVPGTVLP